MVYESVCRQCKNCYRWLDETARTKDQPGQYELGCSEESQNFMTLEGCWRFECIQENEE